MDLKIKKIENMSSQKDPSIFQYKVEDKVACIWVKPLLDNGIAPPLKMGEEYEVKSIVLDGHKNQHLDVGLISEYNYIRSKETLEELPNGDKIHWCHPSRFVLQSKS